MEKTHFKCWLWKILWMFGGLSLVLGWASSDTGAIAGLSTGMWLWSALILATLSITAKLDCSDCNVCKAKEPQKEF